MFVWGVEGNQKGTLKPFWRGPILKARHAHANPMGEIPFAPLTLLSTLEPTKGPQSGSMFVDRRVGR